MSKYDSVCGRKVKVSIILIIIIHHDIAMVACIHRVILVILVVDTVAIVAAVEQHFIYLTIDVCFWTWF